MPAKTHQYIAIILSVCLVVVFYVGCSTKDPKMKSVEKSRLESFEVLSIESVKKVAFDSLSADQRAFYQGLTLELDQKTEEKDRIATMKKISGFWFQQGNFAMAGDVADRIAKKANTPEAWSIAATTYVAGMKNEKNDNIRNFCQSKAVDCFERAIEMEPNNVNHRTNLAVCYAEKPPKDNPMKGILMLLDLDKKHPDNVGVLFQLARFGMQTNQYDKAINRLLRVIKINPNIIKAHCLLADAYKTIDNLSAANKHLKVCTDALKK